MIVLKRVIVAAIFIPLILVVFFNGGYPLLALLSIFTFFGLYELRLLFKEKYGLIPIVVLPLGVIFLWLTPLLGSLATIFSLLFILLIVAGYDIFLNRIDGAVNRIALSLFAVIYQPFLYSYVFRLRNVHNGEYLLMAIIILIWITDTAAYFLGMLVGKHRGVFKVSPQKSVEGFIFGIIFAFIGAYILYLLLSEWVTLPVMLLTALSVAFFGQLGDLLESLIKRDTGVKDSSQIIPGHGGVLDRFDSFIIAAPVFYILYKLFV
jgi:phosphatidate cytidylyltransferase